MTVQAQVLDLLKELAGKARSALILITHDLGVVAGALGGEHDDRAGALRRRLRQRRLG